MSGSFTSTPITAAITKSHGRQEPNRAPARQDVEAADCRRNRERRDPTADDVTGLLGGLGVRVALEREEQPEDDDEHPYAPPDPRTAAVARTLGLHDGSTAYTAGSIRG
jgi:hypothetical protein